MASNLTQDTVGAIANQPSNINYLSPISFRFGIKKLPTTNYFVQKVNLPGILVNPVYQATPFKKVPVPGDHMEHEMLQVTFKVDEYMRNWLEIYGWMVGIAYPDSFNQYSQLAKEIATSNGKGVRSDATLLINSSSNNPILEVTYQGIFPISLSGLDFSSSTPDIDYVQATAFFEIQGHKIKLLTSSDTVPPS